MSKTTKRLVAIIVFAVVTVAVIAAAVILTSGLGGGEGGNHAILGWLTGGGQSEGGGGFFGGGGGSTQTLPDLNFLILGLDDEAGLADTVMVGIFNGETGYVDLISVPRDSVVEVTPQLREEFAAIGRQGWVSGLNSFILAEMTTRARPHGREFIQNHLEAILDIEIDYYVAMDLAAFRYIVDAVGGISMYIPQPGLRYFGNEYGPGGIDIDVPPGYQMLDGRRAEMVVRFRNHPRGDLFRVELQQQFMTNFFAQSLNQESIMNDPMTLVTTFITHVETNLGIISAAQYNAAGMFGMLNADNIAFHMMPGRLDRRYIIDEAAARQLVADIRDGTTRMEEEESFDD